MFVCVCMCVCVGISFKYSTVVASIHWTIKITSLCVCVCVCACVCVFVYIYVINRYGIYTQEHTVDVRVCVKIGHFIRLRNKKKHTVYTHICFPL